MVDDTVRIRFRQYVSQIDHLLYIIKYVTESNKKLFY